MIRRLSLARLTLLALVAVPLAAADGDLDATFWGDGKLELSATGDVSFGGMATTANGEMVVGYSVGSGSPSSDFAYWRRVSDSSLGTACRVLVGPAPPENHIDDRILDMAFDSSRRLLVLTQRLDLNGEVDSTYVLAFTFPYCRLDQDFGTDGIVTLTGVDLEGLRGSSRLATMNDGRILIAGWERNETWAPFTRVVRLNADGDFDPTFSNDGMAYGPTECSCRGLDLAVAPNGHIVMAGRHIQFGYVDDFLVHEFSENGTFLGETSVAFDLGGSNEDLASGITTTPDGRVVVVGKAAGSGTSAFEWAAMAMLSWDAQGELALDPSFSADGKLAFRFGTRNYNSLSDVVFQGTNRILVSGTSKTQIIDNAMAVARIALDGSFDGTFYPPGSGRRLVDFDVAAPENDLANRLILQQGRIVLGGQVDVAGGLTGVGLARIRNQWMFGGGFDQLEFGDWVFSLP